jgi:hypothetical protein
VSIELEVTKTKKTFETKKDKKGNRIKEERISATMSSKLGVKLTMITPTDGIVPEIGDQYELKALKSQSKLVEPIPDGKDARCQICHRKESTHNEKSPHKFKAKEQ